MDGMSPQQQQQDRGGGQHEYRRHTKFQSYRRQSAPSMVISKALTRSKTLSRESVLVPVCPESCPLVQSLLTGSDRTFLLHGQVQLKAGMQTQDRHLFLFSDILVVAKAKSASHFKQKALVSVCQMWTAGCMDEVCEGSTSPDRSFVMGWPTWNCVALFSSADLKDKWLSVLKSRIKEEKEREEPKTIPLRVYGKGINTFAVTKTLPVSNSDSTNEVIRLALQQFGIIGNVKDFQLWVVSQHDNTPYPLIGHEFPFSIHTSPGGALQQPTDLIPHCQFVLKPRRPAEPPADFSQKPFRRRRSLVGWAFWRGSSPQLSELALSTAAAGRLFGQKLSAVCDQDALPKPVMDMLVFLYHEGSWTRGIFRRSAGARAVRELRDALDAGELELPLTRDHVFIIAAVFKDFLRSIPGSLLGSDLYQEWLDVLEEEDDEAERVQDIQRLMSRLDRENALLLRYLLALLHAVQSNSHENQMTSFNLSVCFAPSLLWPPAAPCSSELEGDGAKKVCELVKFMIEHCERILGEEPSAVFGGHPQRPGSEESRQESWVYPLTDSSYDSLENELDDASPTADRKSARPEKLPGSLDSILTLSDYDLDVDVDVGLRRNERLRCFKICPADRRRRPQLPASSGSDVPVTVIDSPSPGQRPRRRSEPAIAYVSKLRPFTVGEGGDAAQSRPAGVSPCPSSPPASPSGDSLDSLSGPESKAEPLTPKESARAGQRVNMGLHPNSWLRKDRRLSLTQQDGPDGEDRAASSQAKPKPGRTVPSPLEHRAAALDSPCSPPIEGAPARAVKLPSPSLFYRPGAPALSLFRRQKTQESGERLRQRRGSEPGKVLVDRASGPAPPRARLPSDPGLKVSEVDVRAGVPAAVEPRFCLSPGATKTVRDYFSCHPRSPGHSGQQVALALVQSRREWLRRCSDPTVEADLDQLLFAEESYV